jgi:hypothetical protein
VTFANQPIRGIGSGILATLAGLADSLGMETMWGEATASSASFYERVLRIHPVRDLFVLQRDMLHDIARRYFAKQEQRLAKAGRAKQSP